MEYAESFEKVANRMRSFEDVDKSRFWVNAGKRLENEFLILWEVNSILSRDIGRYAIQCRCGRLDIIDEQIFNNVHKPLITTEAPSLECSRCKKFNIELDAKWDVPPRVGYGLEELRSLFGKARSENYMTYCFFLWQALSIEGEQLREIETSIDLIFDQYLRNNLEIFLMNNKLTPMRIENDYHQSRQHINYLLALSHIMEIDGLYDLILSIVAIALSEQYLVGDDGLSIHPVGMRLVAPPSNSGEGERTNYKLAQLKKYLRERKLHRTAKLIQIAFNFELRNAFSHAEYRLTDLGVHLTKYNRLVTYKQLEESFTAAFFTLQIVASSIFQDRQKFTQAGGYAENGWQILPNISENGIAVTIQSDSPLPRPTGFKRTGLKTEESSAN